MYTLADCMFNGSANEVDVFEYSIEAVGAKGTTSNLLTSWNDVLSETLRNPFYLLSQWTKIGIVTFKSEQIYRIPRSIPSFSDTSPPPHLSIVNWSVSFVGTLINV